MYNNVALRNGAYGIVHYDKKGNETFFEEKGRAVNLDKVFQNLETGEVTWQISFEFLGQIKHHIFERSKIAEKKLVSFLQGQGADVTAKTFNYFVDSMRLQEAQMARSYNVYRHLGWIQVPTGNGQTTLCYRCNKILGQAKGKYVGNLALKPHGTYEKWEKMVKEDVLGHAGLETVLLAALSAPIVGILSLHMPTENPIIHINFASGKGKSTVCFLAASVSGEPFDGMRMATNNLGTITEESSVYSSWGATPKATLTVHAGNQGMVVILNELGKFAGSDLSTVIFNLSDGSDINRLNAQLEMHVTEAFKTVFISSGEMSLVKRCKSKLQGIKTRIMEIQKPMTTDAEHSRRIKAGSCDNNGFAAPMLAEYILENGGFDMVYALYTQTVKELTATAPSNIEDRFIEKFPAFFVAAAKIAKKALDLEFDIDAVVKFCYDCCQASAAEEGSVDDSYSDVIGECGTNLRNFYNPTSNPTPYLQWGAVSYPAKLNEKNQRVDIEYAIRKPILAEILEKHGHPNMNTCLAKWKTAGVLNHEAGRYTRLRTINANGIKEDVYVLRVLQNTEADNE